MENLARYIIRASFSQKRMSPYDVRVRLYIPEESKLSYQSKACPRPRSGNGKEEKVFDALEWPCPVNYNHAHCALASLQAFASSNVVKFNSSI
jgi:hypothetical protein